MTEYEKYRQIKREALWTGVVLVVLIVFWWAAGFGLAGSAVKLFGLPLWTLTGSVGVWVFAIVLVKLLTKFVFRDMDFDGEDGK